MLKPINDYIVAKKVEETKKGMLILREEKFNVIYDVCAVSNNIEDVKVGDRIMIEKYQFQQIDIEDEPHFLINIKHVLGIIE